MRYGDTDKMGVAYYANYLVWFEVGRYEYMRAKGYPYTRLEAEAIGMPVTEARCRYLAPAHYDDVLSVDTALDEIGYVQVRFSYKVSRKGDGRLIATGSTRHAAVGPGGRPRRIPEEVKRWLSA